MGTLPKEITNLIALEVSCECDKKDPDLAESIDDLMDEHFEQIIEVLAEKYELTEEQISELEERLSWTVCLTEAK